MSIREQPHYRLQAAVLADWLHGQPETSWWSVDGDPVLTERLNFPCPADDLAEEIRCISKSMLLLASDSLQDKKNGGDIATTELDGLAFVDKADDRVFQLCWENADPEIDWILAEDKEAGESSSSSSSAEV